MLFAYFKGFNLLKLPKHTRGKAHILIETWFVASDHFAEHFNKLQKVQTFTSFKISIIFIIDGSSEPF